MIEETFVLGNSAIHRLDPRVRTITAAAFSLVVALSDRFTALVPAALFAGLLLLLARLPLREVATRVLIVNGFILFLWLFLPFSFQGEPLFAVGPLRATREGILYSAQITLKSNAILSAVIALVATMPLFTMGRAMRNLRVPERIVYLFFFTYRYVHVIHAEYQRLLRAIKIRGFHPGTNMHTYKTYAYLVGMLLVKSHERAQRVRAAMVCRGFKGKFYDLSEFAFKRSDLLILLVVLSGTAAVALLQWAG